MNGENPLPLRPEYQTALRLEVACEFSAVRLAIAQIHDWLAEKGLPETDLGAWDLALVEAANNAVKYVRVDSRDSAVVIEMNCGAHWIEARITDHTAGFEWPDETKLPGMEAEGGRGLFLIQSLTESAKYFRGADENILILRRSRPAANQIIADAGECQRRLAETENALTEMTAELASTYESLVALFRYSSELGARLDLKEFSQRLLRDLVRIVEADGAAVRLLSTDGQRLETFFVLPEKHLPPLPAPGIAGEIFSIEVAAAQMRQDIWFSPAEPLAENDPLRAILPVGNGVCHAFFVADQLIGTVALGRLAAEKPFTAAQLNLLHSFLDFLAIQTVNARLLDERTTARVTQRELEIAAEIQRSLLPVRLPDCPPFTIAAVCQNALQVGGDFYDVISGSNGAVLLVIADVMGKGVPAALFAALLRSTIRSMPQLFARPGELLGAVNQILFPDLSRVDMFITAQMIYLEPASGQIISTNAGHCPLLRWRAGETQKSSPKQSGFPLGIEPNATYTQTVGELSSGAAALIYTDGLIELRNADGECFGESRLSDLLHEVATQTLNAACGKEFLLQRLAAFRGDAPLTDDLTFIFIRHQT